MLYLIVIEPIETRYTCEWYEYLPKLLASNGIGTTIIEGNKREYKTSTGAFLDFSATNIYKSEQVIQIAELFSAGKIKDGDQFLFLDAWHPGIINIKYMATLNNIDVKLHGIWHAGSYDPYDFLGYVIKDKGWVRLAERTYFEALDYNYFASQFHINMFCKNLLTCSSERPIRTGFPFEYMKDIFSKYKSPPQERMKEDIIVFPHRKAKEKQLDIFLDLKSRLPQYEFIVCGDYNFTKQEYRDLLGKSKLVFSANLQETFGISCYEILACGGMCLVPRRLSYIEMYSGDVVYPSIWTASNSEYQMYRNKVADRIVFTMENFYTPRIQETIKTNVEFLEQNYFSAQKMIGVIKNGTTTRS